MGKAWMVDFHFGAERCRRRSPLNAKEGAIAYELYLRKEACLHGSIAAALRAWPAELNTDRDDPICNLGKTLTNALDLLSLILSPRTGARQATDRR